MNKQLKKKWIKALESGKYPKGEYCLRRKGTESTGGKDEYCCLGVLIDICYKRAPWKLAQTSDRYEFKGFGDVIEPTKRKEWLGADSDDIEAKLVSINDNTRSFDEVIDYIKKEL